ncbi:kinesin-like protein KIF28 [Glandiceps talaboti]
MKVVVRVRPFNERERNRNALCIVQMFDKTTELTNPDAPDNEPKRFAFDYSYWSHDGFRERPDDKYLEGTNPKYIDQHRVFDDLGRKMLDNAWKGYNCSLFAYGQTGSGKSYSIMGYGSNKGVVPMTCEELFNGITERQKSATAQVDFQVTVSMIEIYNEQVKDLLNPKNTPKGGLKVREHRTKGFYVDSVKVIPVNSFADIESQMNEGTRNRTIAATNMNATSSRAHTIVTITLLQKRTEGGQSLSKTAVINLVDLAGSERADQTGATGDRLKEGSMINQSLTTLGNVIKALGDLGSGKKVSHVPYRDSVLTRLLKNALGGNSKTIMIAAISPADINYEETLSTLRYADRAKSIKTKAVVNESETDKLIRELKEENARLLQQMMSGGNNAALGQMMGIPEDEVEEMKKMLEGQIRRNKEEMADMEKSWQQRLAETEASSMDKLIAEQKKQAQMKVVPHFWNLNEDPSLTAMIVHFVTEGVTKIGNGASSQADILLKGLSIQKDHAIVTNKKMIVKLKVCKNAKVLINGKEITEDVVELHHNDRVMFGSNHLYVFHHPQDLAKYMKSGKKEEKVSYDQAQAEIAENSGFHIEARPGMSKYDLLLQEDLIQMLPMVNEANAIAEELGKNAHLKIALVSPMSRGLKEGRTEVNVILRNLDNNNEFMWNREKFLNRKYLMQEMYQKYMEGDQDWNVDREKDPFWEPPETEVHIGNGFVHMQSLEYLVDSNQTLQITDYRSQERGHVTVEMVPCRSDGSLLSEEDMIDDPQQLLHKNLYFRFRIPYARGIPPQYNKSFCKYRVFMDEEMTSSKHISGTSNPDYNHENIVKTGPVTQQLLNYLENEPMVVEVWGTQYDHARGVVNTNHTDMYNTHNHTTQEADHYYNLQEEILILRKKLYNIQELVEEAKSSGKETVPIDDVDEILGDEYIELPVKRSRTCTLL